MSRATSADWCNTVICCNRFEEVLVYLVQASAFQKLRFAVPEAIPPLDSGEPLLRGCGQKHYQFEMRYENIASSIQRPGKHPKRFLDRLL